MLRFVRAASLPSSTDWKDSCAHVYPSLFQLQKESILVTGFFVSAGGVGLTVHHFWEEFHGNLKGAVLKHNGKTYTFKVLARSRERDVMVVQAESSNPFPYLHFSQTPVNIGDQVLVFGTNARFIHCFTSGFVLDPVYPLMKTVTFPCIRSSCRAVPGYSGGPLTLPSGEVVGMHKAGTNLFEKLYDSAAIPTLELLEVLKTVARETNTGWERK